MGLAGAGEIVAGAKAAGVGAGSFNVVGLEYAEAIVAGATSARSPVILQISENCVKYHGAVEPVVIAALAVARGSECQVAVHLDHATSADLIRAAVRAGVGSVMYDASALGYGANVDATAQVADWCHNRDVWVEAELGEVGGKDGVHAAGARTRPDEAAAYVEATGVDALAVAVGSSHAMLSRDARLDLELIREIRRGRAGAAGAARVIWRARRSARRGRAGRDDQDQHRDSAQQGVHFRCARTTKFCRERR